MSQYSREEQMLVDFLDKITEFIAFTSMFIIKLRTAFCLRKWLRVSLDLCLLTPIKVNIDLFVD